MSANRCSVTQVQAHLARSSNGHRVRRLVPSRGRDCLHSVDDVHPLDDVAENDLPGSGDL